MTGIVLYAKCAKESAQKLARALSADCVCAFDAPTRNFTNYDFVFNYGANRLIVPHRKHINKAKAVSNCIDKLKTFKLLKDANVPIPSFVEKKEEVPKSWKDIVCRKNRCGNQADSLQYIRKGQFLPEAQLYTKYFEHKFEFRIVVFRGEVVGRYLKEQERNMWLLNSMDREGFEKIDEACIRGSDALGIDYVGFDVLSNSQDDFIVLEANSAPIITDESVSAIKTYLES